MFFGKEGDIYVRIYSQAKYMTLVLGNSHSRDDSSWVKLHNYIILTKHLLCFRIFQSKILPFLVYFTLNVYSAIIQILVDLKICVALQLNSSVFVYFCYVDTTALF
jgi:hypothetical protein